MVERLKAEHGAEVEWRPFLLRPDTPPEGMELPAHIRARMAGTANAERLKQMARAAGLEMVTPTRIPNARRAHEATEYAGQQGKGEAFHRVVFRQFYGEGRDISRWEVLREAAAEVGLNPDVMQRETDSGQYRAVVEAHFDEAYARGISGVPTYILDDKHAIVGAQPYEAFQQALARLAAESGESSGK